MACVEECISHRKSRKFKERLNTKIKLDFYKQFGKSVEFKKYLHGVCDAITSLFKFRSDTLKACSHCTLDAHSIRFNAHWFAFTMSRRECALSQSGLKPVWLNPLCDVV